MLRECHNNQGTVAAEIRDPESAIKHHKKWMELTLASPDPVDGYEIAICHNETGVAFGLKGDFPVSADCFLQSIEKMKSLPQFKATMLDWPMPNLGFIYWIQGKHKEAKAVLETIRDIKENAFGRDDTTSFKYEQAMFKPRASLT